MLNRRDFLSLTGASVLAGAHGAAAMEVPSVGTGQGSAPVAQRQNLILFMPDEMRADSLACYRNPVTQTPNFDRLASEGFRFDQAHVQFPVCGASRCAMLTGWPTSVRGHRSLYYFLRPEEPNLFRYLRQAGYDVFWFGKNDALASQSFYDSVTEWRDAGIAATMRTLRIPPQSLTPGSTSMLYSPLGARTETSDYKLLQMAIRVLNRKEADRPFCIFLPLSEPHPPYTAPKDFYDLYSPSAVDPLVPPGLRGKPEFHTRIREEYGLNKLAEETFRKIRAVYYGQVSYSDWLLGELLEALDKTGRSKDTALFVTSDHGDYAGDYGLIEKWPSGLEDCLTRVPLLGRVPGGKKGALGKDVVEMYDIMQTFLEIAGTSANHTHFSRSLLPVIGGGRSGEDRAAFAEGGYNVYEPQCFEPDGAALALYGPKIHLQNAEPVTVSRSAMVRTKKHKLIVRPQGQSELYSLIDDPRETRNVYGESGVEKVQHGLESELLRHFIETTGIAPMDKDPRDAPPWLPSPAKPGIDNWQKHILDRSLS